MHIPKSTFSKSPYTHRCISVTWIFHGGKLADSSGSGHEVIWKKAWESLIVNSVFKINFLVNISNYESDNSFSFIIFLELAKNLSKTNPSFQIFIPSNIF